jgi:hypothetical protein
MACDLGRVAAGLALSFSIELRISVPQFGFGGDSFRPSL